MNDDLLLFAAALANPAEDTPRLVLADWFDEHDEPALALALREEPRLIAFLAELARWDTVPQWNAPRDRPEQRDVDTRRFSRAGCQLLRRFDSQFPVPPEAPTEFHLDAPPAREVHDPLDPNSFLWRWLRARQRQIGQLRERAAREADNLPPAMRHTLGIPKGNSEHFEYSACLLHELVIRQRTGNVVFDGLQREMRDRQHPLAWLPPRLLPVESELHQYLPHFTPSGGGFALPHNGGEPLGVSSGTPIDGPTILDSETVPEDSPLFSAVRGWAEESNGRLEGAVYHLDRPLTAETTRDWWFAKLSAESLAGALTPPRWTVNRRTPAGALAQLFVAAHTGGAYGRRECGAYGRLHAWQSFAALAGCEAGADAVGIAAEVDRCEWLSFGGTDWFDGIIDMGLICVRPNRLSVAILAASDTD